MLPPVLKYEIYVRETTDLLERKMNNKGNVPFFFTITYLEKHLLDEYGSNKPIVIPSAIKSFENGYAEFTSWKYILDDHPERKKHLRPIVYAWLDSPYPKSKPTNDGLTGFQNKKAERGNPENDPHIPSIMLVHPKTVQRV